MLKHPLLALLILLGGTLHAQTWLYFQDSPTTGSYDYSWMEVVSPSILERIGTKFPVESTIPAVQGNNSLRMHWNSKTGGSWFAIAAGLDWTAKDISHADTLAFYFRSQTALSKSLLPKVFFEDVSNVKSTFQSVSSYAIDLAPGVWTRIAIPMSIFYAAGDPIDFSSIKTVGFAQATDDGVDHTVYVDDVKVFKGDGSSPPVSAPQGVAAKGYEKHIFISWTPNTEPNVSGYNIYRSTDNGQSFVKRGSTTADICMYTDDIRSMGSTPSAYYYVVAINDLNQPSPNSDTVSASPKTLTDEELLDMVQEANFRYFWDYAQPNSGMARERLGSANTVTTGGSGFGVMALLVGIERNYITREQGIERMNKILTFLQNADRFHGAWPHWINGNTGKVIPFSTKDDGGDLVETSFLIQGLLTARQYFNLETPEEIQLRNTITQLWEEVEYDWYRKNNSNYLYWHWSPTYNWEMNFALKGWNECMIVYILGMMSPTHAVPASMWTSGWTSASYYVNGGKFYGIPLAVGWDYGGPLFFAHYSFLGFDARNKKDQFTNYFINNAHHAQINYQYCVSNPKSMTGYGPNCWGLTASDDPDGYLAHEPYSNDNGTISPTAALSSFPYTPNESMAALKHFYRDRGDKLWGNFGFIDAFNLKRNWFASSYLAIDQGPIVDMIENYRTGLLWNLFMENPEVQPALDGIGFVHDSTNAVNDRLDLHTIKLFPNPAHIATTIQSDESIRGIHVYDITGRSVVSLEVNNQHSFTLPTNSLPAGIYIIEVETNKAVTRSTLSVR